MTRPRDLPPLALIYDRHSGPDRAVLDERLDRCRAYAETKGWETVGEPWVEEGDFALLDTPRPRHEALVRELAAIARTGRAVVCLIADAERLSRAQKARARMCRRITEAGGWVETTDGDSTLIPQRYGALVLHRLGS